MFTANRSLKDLNTFAMNVSAKKFAIFDSIDSLTRVLKEVPKTEKMLFLGGGSNILFTKDFDGYVLKNEIKGINLLQETDTSYHIQIGAGENWHQLVLSALDNAWYGLENMSLIPGTIGAAPIQNIGAYGRDIKDLVI